MAADDCQPFQNYYDGNYDHAVSVCGNCCEEKPSKKLIKLQILFLAGQSVLISFIYVIDIIYAWAEWLGFIKYREITVDNSREEQATAPVRVTNVLVRSGPMTVSGQSDVVAQIIVESQVTGPQVFMHDGGGIGVRHYPMRVQPTDPLDYEEDEEAPDVGRRRKPIIRSIRQKYRNVGAVESESQSGVMDEDEGLDVAVARSVPMVPVIARAIHSPSPILSRGAGAYRRVESRQREQSGEYVEEQDLESAAANPQIIFSRYTTDLGKEDDDDSSVSDRL